ncbi:hypothetical protein [Pedobacter sp. JCM 36344]|uniref:hypothetical protein n=1 Tax=Pedobacter sp. JCM 36344 TaxID=3374280 RepID=UPI00397B9CFD
MKQEENIKIELEFWKREMLKKPSMTNSYIPDKIHNVVTFLSSQGGSKVFVHLQNWDEKQELLPNNYLSGLL